MQTESTLLVARSDVERLLTLPECIDAVEEAFRLQGEGKIPATGILGMRTRGGGLHVKTAIMTTNKNYLVAKLNTNFPSNGASFGLPTIQGVIFIADATNGSPLALLDSIDITIKRTAAATAVGAKYLARKNSSVAAICGCGVQGKAQIRAVNSILSLEKVYVFDLNESLATNLATELSRELKINIEPVRNLPGAIRNSDVVVTCTPATEFVVHKEDVAPGTFIAAVGADDADKQEIEPALMASAKIIADSREQSCTIGDTHHAIAKRLMSREDVYGELSEVVAGQKPGRISDDEIIVFDSTGIAIEDAVAAVAVYEKARTSDVGTYFEFAA